MSAEAIAMEQLDLAKLQLLITGLAIFLGPLAGIVFTLWFQRRKEKVDAKARLFMALMAHRRSNPPTYEFVNSLNLIDVVFAENPEVIRLWHEYYDLLCQSPINGHLVEGKHLDLLSSMARVLGYSSLSQTDIARYYSPIAHGNQAQLNLELQLEFLRVLQGSESFSNSRKTT